MKLLEIGAFETTKLSHMGFTAKRFYIEILKKPLDCSEGFFIKSKLLSFIMITASSYHTNLHYYLLLIQSHLLYLMF
jgi:hypothetical protein